MDSMKKHILFYGAILITLQVTHQKELTHRQYHLINLRRAWTEAQNYCRVKHTDLASVDNMTEVDSLIVASREFTQTAWIGLERRGTMKWHWSLADPGLGQTGYTNWRAGEPSLGPDYCVIMNKDGTWNDDLCWKENNYVCVRGESYDDLRYTVVQTPRSWRSAQLHCRADYRDLAIVLNDAQNKVVQEKFGSTVWHAVGEFFGNHETLWIGMFRDAWRWSDPRGSSSFRLWGSGQPSGQNCVGAMTNGQWQDLPCDTTLPFFCHGDEKKKRTMVTMKLLTNVDLLNSTIQQQVLQQLEALLEEQGLTDFTLNGRIRIVPQTDNQ